MLSDAIILDSLEESISIKKDTTSSLCPSVYFMNVYYGFAMT